MAFENKGAMAATVVVAASDSLNKAAANYVCDGVADNVEIQAAIDALPAGGKIVLLDGTYYEADSLHIDKEDMILEFQSASMIATAPANIITITANNVTVINAKIDGVRASYDTRGIRVENVTGTRLINPYIVNCLRQGIHIIHTDVSEDRSFISNPYVSGCGSVIGESNITLWKCIGAMVIGGRSTGNTVDNGLYFAESYNCVADGIRLDNNVGNGIHSNSAIDGKGNILLSIIAHNNTASGFLCNYADLIVGCWGYSNGAYGIAPGLKSEMLGCKFNSNNRGVYIYPGASTRYDVIIDGCEINGNTNEGVRNYNATYVSITNCHINNNGTYGINEAGATDYSKYVNNTYNGNGSGGLSCVGVHNIYDRDVSAIASLDLSGGATDVTVFNASYSCRLMGYTLLYTEASSADAGVVVRVGRYQDGVALNSTYYDSVTSEVSKNMGYTKNYTTADLSQKLIAAGDTVTVGTAGGKVGTGEVIVILHIAEMAS